MYLHLIITSSARNYVGMVFSKATFGLLSATVLNNGEKVACINTADSKESDFSSLSWCTAHTSVFSFFLFLFTFIIIFIPVCPHCHLDRSAVYLDLRRRTVGRNMAVCITVLTPSSPSAPPSALRSPDSSL